METATTTQNLAKTIKLPSGDIVQVKTPNVPERNLKKFCTEKAEYRIPVSILDEKLAADIWPTTKILDQEAGVNTIPENELWTGTQKQWNAILRGKRAETQGRRVEKLRQIRACQQALRKISKSDWEAINRIFSFQKHFHA